MSSSNSPSSVKPTPSHISLIISICLRDLDLGSRLLKSILDILTTLTFTQSLVSFQADTFLRTENIDELLQDTRSGINHQNIRGNGHIGAFVISLLLAFVINHRCKKLHAEIIVPEIS